MTPAIEIRKVRKHYGELQALAGVDVDILPRSGCKLRG